MKETILKISQEIADSIKTHFATAEFQETIATLKAVGDTGTFKIVVSTDDVDRHGEIVDQDGWQLNNYMTNPVVLWGHNHNQIPVGITDKMYIETTGTRKSLIAEGRFADHEFAQTLRKLYEAGMLKTASVGFIPMKYEGNRIVQSELLEWSFVSIPANPYALALVQNGFNFNELVSKGVVSDIEIKEGDVVETTEEKPKEEEKAEETTTTEEQTTEAPKEEEKGALADQVAEQNARKVKYEKFEKLGNLYWAFCDVYFDEETSPEDFDVLLAEFVSLLSGETVENSRLVISNNTDEWQSKSLEKAGRVLSEKNKTKILEAKIALEEVLSLTEEEEKEADVPERKDSDVEIDEEADKFIKRREMLQSLATVCSSVLAEVKVEAKERGIKFRN